MGRVVVGLLATLLCVGMLATRANAHGYLSQPRSRQLYAAQEGKWWCADPDACIRKESEPHSANRRLPTDACGTIGGRTFDTATSLAGDPVPFPVKAVYAPGEAITITADFTINHRGHFEFRLCDEPLATTECFERRPALQFVDTIEFYDPAYPERLYMDPRGSPSSLTVTGLKLPDGLTCEHCVLQWTWYTANSCLPPGYRTTPPAFRSTFALNLGDCQLPFDHTGDMAPERFWNCADIRIGDGNSGPTPAPTSSSPTPAPTQAPTTAAPTPAPTTQSPPAPGPSSAPTPAPTGSGNACDATGSWPSSVCWPGTSGPCRGPDTVCWQPYASGQCYANTVDCRAAGGNNTPPPATAAPTPAPTQAVTPAPTPAPTTQPPATPAPTPAPETPAPTTSPTQPPTPSPTPAPTTQSPTPAPTGGGNACDATGSWPSGACWPGTSGPCRGPDTVCWQPYASGQCYANTVDCRAAGGNNTPPPTTAAPTPAPTQAVTPSPSTQAPTQAPTPTSPSQAPTPGATPAPTMPPPTGGQKFVMYYESWATYGRNFQVADMDASTITHVNYGFANIANGRCVLGDAYADTDKAFPGDTWDQPLRGNFHQLALLKAAHPHLRTLISVGGWTWSGQFSSVASTAAGRQLFAESCVEFMRTYGFDGIDIDWEYPVEGGADPSGNPADRDNYTLLLAELRAALDAATPSGSERKLLTIASSPNPAYVGNMDLAAMDDILDWVNVMTYDYNGAWQSTSAHNAPLTPNPAPSNPFPGYSVAGTVDAYLAAGLRRSKLVVGMPTYGRAWRSMPAGPSGTGLFSSCGGSCPATGTWEAGVLDYKDIAANYVTNPAYTRHWDAVSGVPFLYNGDVFVSYDDAESICLKSDFVMDSGLGGAMVWAASSDRNHELQHVIAARVLEGRSCSEGGGAGRRRHRHRRLMRA